MFTNDRGSRLKTLNNGNYNESDFKGNCYTTPSIIPSFYKNLVLAPPANIKSKNIAELYTLHNTQQTGSSKQANENNCLKYKKYKIKYLKLKNKLKIEK